MELIQVFLELYLIQNNFDSNVVQFWSWNVRKTDCFVFLTLKATIVSQRLWFHNKGQIFNTSCIFVHSHFYSHIIMLRVTAYKIFQHSYAICLKIYHQSRRFIDVKFLNFMFEIRKCDDTICNHCQMKHG